MSVAEMGSFCSRERLFFKNENCQFEKMNGNGLVKSTESKGPANEKNKEKSAYGTTNQEKHGSYLWLASSPVDFLATGKEDNQPITRPKERRNQPKCIIKYNNGKYLKCYQHIAKTPPASNTKFEQRESITGSQSSSSAKHSNYRPYHNSGCGTFKQEKETRQTNSAVENNPDILRTRGQHGGSYPVGFGEETDICRQGGSTDKAAVEEEKRRNRQNVWFTVKVFVGYVALLRLAPYAYKALSG